MTAITATKPIMNNLFKNFQGSSSDKINKALISSPTITTTTKLSNPDALSEKVFYDVVSDYLPNESLASNNSHLQSGESANLNVKKGDLVQLLSESENNMVLVKLINRLGKGLVPTRCLSINVALNSSPNVKRCMSPITSPISSPITSPNLSLTESAFFVHTYNDILQPENSTLSLDFAIQNCQVTCVNIKDNRAWYRLDCDMASGNKRILCRYYQDFYWLQLQFLKKLKSRGLDYKCLPFLPTPTSNVKLEGSNRCEEFNTYIKNLFHSQNIPNDIKKQILINNWLSPRAGDLVRTSKNTLYRVSSKDNNNQDEPDCDIIMTDNITDDIILKNLFPRPTTIFKQDTIENASVKRCLSDSDLPTESQNNTNVALTPSTSVLTSNSFLSENNSIKVKINYKNDCYVVKCFANDMETYDKLHHLVKIKISKNLPDFNHQIKISRKLENGKLADLTFEDYHDFFKQFVTLNKNGKLSLFVDI